MLMAWKMRDIIDILQLGFTINSAALFLPTIAAIYWHRLPAGAAFWSSSMSLATVIGWRIAADAGAGGIFAIDPLWPGLLVSFAVLDRDARRSAPSGPRKPPRERGPVIVFAEMPEAAGRDLSIERQQLPPSARIENLHVPRRQGGADRRVSRRRRDPDRLRALRRLGAAASAPLPHHLGGRHGVGLCGRARSAARGIGVSCVGEYCTQEVADHTLALLLALNRRLLAYHEQVQTHHGLALERGTRRPAPRGTDAGSDRVRPHRSGRLPPRPRLRARGAGVGSADRRQTARRHEARLCDLDELLASSHISACTATCIAGNLGLLNRDAFARCGCGPCSSTWRAADLSSRRTSFARSTRAR